MSQFANRAVVYLIVALVLTAAVAGLVTVMEDTTTCRESDTGCAGDIVFLIVTLSVLATVMPGVIFFGEKLARDRRKRAS